MNGAPCTLIILIRPPPMLMNTTFVTQTMTSRVNDGFPYKCVLVDMTIVIKKQ